MQRTPNLNLRSVLFNGTEYLLSEVKNLEDTRLCDHCGNINDCAAEASLRRLRKRHKVGAIIARCKDFSPGIAFTFPVEGVDGRFNTFRVGKAWGNRILVGTVLTLVERKRGEPDRIMGQARVVERHTGPLSEMLATHAANNHALLGKQVDDPARALQRILERAFGKNFMGGPTSPYSVIYMERIKDGDEDRPG